MVFCKFTNSHAENLEKNLCKSALQALAAPGELGYEPLGSLLLGGAGDAPRLRARAAGLAAAGVPCRLLEASELATREPALAAAATAGAVGLLVSSDAQLVRRACKSSWPG